MTIKLLPEINSQIEGLARASQRNKSDVIRQAIAQLLKQENVQGKISAFALLEKFCGKVQLPRDLSSNTRHMDGYGE